MNKKTKILLQQNNEFEKTLNEINKKVLTDIVVYLRGCNISEFHQEEVRRDIMQIVADGEARNESIESVIGEDFKAFCNEIVEALPPLSRKEKILAAVSQVFVLTSLMLGIWFAGEAIEAILNKTSIAQFYVTLGDVINGVLIVTIAIVVVNYICKTSFLPVEEPSRIKLFLVAWAILFLIFGSIYLIGHFITLSLFRIPIIVTVLLIGGLYVASRFIDVVILR